MRIELDATFSQAASALLSLKGKPLGFEDYLPFRMVYDMEPDLMVLKAGRQIGKTVSQGGKLAVKSILHSFFNSLYISPSQIQTKRFSSMYVDPFINSPLVKKHFTNNKTMKNVYEKGFNNGSTIFLSYAENENDADRIRGIMADQLLVDEVQDVSYDALAPINEILSASEYGYKVMSGTAKSTSNTLEHLWQSTNQMEWVVKCEACGKWSIGNTSENCMKICAFDHGPSCMFCGSRIDITKGRWAAALQGRTNSLGFHLPQFIMAANTTPRKWARIREKVEQSRSGGMYSPAKLDNEVFGLSTDLAGKTLSVKECMSCCDPSVTSWQNPFGALENFPVRILGIDWSTTGSEKSFTVASVLGYSHSGKPHLLYAEKMQGIHILTQIEGMINLFRRYHCHFVGSDRGVGVVQVQQMQKELGLEKVIPINYVSSKMKMRWDTQGMFLAADRTRNIDDIVMHIRAGRDGFVAPSYELTQHLWKDALALFEEETMANTRVYRHDKDEPDDWLHSLVFANIAYQYYTGRFET